MEPEIKARADSKLKNLPKERQTEIAEFALTHTLAETTQWLAQSGIEIASSSLSTFLSWYRLHQQFERNDSTAQALAAWHIQQNPAINRDQLYEIGHNFLSLATLEKQDARAWHLLQEADIRRNALHLEIQKYRDQVEARKAAIERELKEAQSTGGISPETVAKIERELNLF